MTYVTRVWTGKGWLYLATLLDLLSRRVIGRAASETSAPALALDA